MAKMLRIKRRISLASSPFYASVAVVFLLGVFMGIFWMVNEYIAYSESIDNIRHTYRTRYRNRVNEEVDKVISFVDYRRSQAEKRTENELRQRVQTAYSIASHMFSRHKDEIDRDRLKDMVVEVLRPIRWSDGRGYYIAGSAESGVIDLYADDPFYEGKDRLMPEMKELRRKIEEIIDIIGERGAGMYRYHWTKPGFEGKAYPKMTFVKEFKPFDWYIGAGVYLDELEEELQADILERIQNIQFARDGEIIGFRFDGTVICHPEKRFVGRSIADFGGGEQERYGIRMWNTGLSEPGEGVINYIAGGEGGVAGATRTLAYVKAYPEWRWVFVAAMSMSEMEKAIESERRTYLRIAFKNTVLFIMLFVVAVLLLLLFAYFYSLRIRQGISLFTDFFRQAADEKMRIDDKHLAFTEFEDLGYLANQMVDDLLQKEVLIRRDELRLDTLLRLSAMEDRCFQEKYDFILERVVRITRSRGGYVALVNTAQTHIKLYSFQQDAMGAERDLTGMQGISRPLESAGLPGEAVRRQSAIVENNAEKRPSNFFPYSEEIHRHLDVPIVNSGRVVLVAGVYNNGDNYDTSDIRQITMLLEGLWLHVLKMYHDEEMARLERQIIAVSEEERSTIGRDLHDDLGSHLSGVMLLCKVLQQKLTDEFPARAEELGAIRDLIREAIEITRRLAKGLYPVHVVENGLELSFEELKIEIEKLFTVKCRMRVEFENVDMENSVAIHLYYITREALFNAARHGSPAKVEVFLQVVDRELRLEIEDDGRGFTLDKNCFGIGLHTMKYRAKAIGVRLSVQSEVGGGTRVLLQGRVQKHD